MGVKIDLHQVKADPVVMDYTLYPLIEQIGIVPAIMKILIYLECIMIILVICSDYELRTKVEKCMLIFKCLF